LWETVKKRGEPEILERSRKEAWRAYLESPLPIRSQHLWRYSDPAVFVPDEEELARRAAPAGAGSPIAETGPDDGAAGFVDGSTGGRCEIFDPSLEQKGVRFLGLGDAARTEEKLVASRLGGLISAGHGKFEALAGAVWRAGLLLYVPRDVQLTRPIRFLIPHDGSPSVGGFRYLVILEEGAGLTLIEEQNGTGASETPAHTFGLGEIYVGRGARLDHVIVQRLPANMRGHMTYRTRLDREARHYPFMVALGGKHTKIDFGTILAGSGSETSLSGVLFGAHRQAFDHHTVHDHASPHTRSDLQMRTVLADRAMSAYTGLIRIGTEAPYSEAYQENRNLVLSEHAKAESIPELEIETDEVQCKHGATVGSVDEEQVYYLMSRGMPRATATRMIVRGFVDAILDKAPSNLKERLGETVEERLRHIG
jgi:Fe-S cluster assembly protein SufD